MGILCTVPETFLETKLYQNLKVTKKFRDKNCNTMAGIDLQMLFSLKICIFSFSFTIVCLALSCGRHFKKEVGHFPLM